MGEYASKINLCIRKKLLIFMNLCRRRQCVGLNSETWNLKTAMVNGVDVRYYTARRLTVSHKSTKVVITKLKYCTDFNTLHPSNTDQSMTTYIDDHSGWLSAQKSREPIRLISLEILHQNSKMYYYFYYRNLYDCGSVEISKNRILQIQN